MSAAVAYVCGACGARSSTAGGCPHDGEPLAATEDPLLGSEVARFRLARLLGKGGMGRVYLGVHPTIGSRVAIKVLAQEYADDQALLERFFTEARAVNLIRHENIIDIIDLDRLPDGRPFIVMEFVDGSTLRDLVDPGVPLPLGGVVYAMLDVLLALDAAHAVGIVHRDLKPDNVIVSPSGRATVLDFGIAKLVGQGTLRTATGIALGTPHYMAPEQILGEPCDARADVYAAGVLLYELVAGRRPFDGNSDFALMEAHMRTPPPTLPREVPAPLIAVIERALAKAADDRFASARDMAIALRDAAATIAATEPARLEAFEAGVILPVPAPIGASGSNGVATKGGVRPSSGSREQPTRPSRPSASAGAHPPVASSSGPVVTAPPRRGDRRLVAILAGVILMLGVALAVVVGKRTPPIVTPVALVADAAVSADARGLDAALADAQLPPPPDAPGDATVAIVADARVVAKLPVMTARVPQGEACTQNSDCANISCTCDPAGMYTLQFCDQGHCRFGVAGCTNLCELRKSKFVAWRVNMPRTSADCAAAPNCKHKGECVARRQNKGDVSTVCVTSCRATQDCTIYGRCSEPVGDGYICVVTDAADCRSSEMCKQAGECALQDGACVRDVEGCRTAAPCTDNGECTLRDGRCVAVTDTECRASRRCKEVGACVAIDGECQPTTEAMCKDSRSCEVFGRCGLRQGECVATKEGCESSSECKRKGDCNVAGKGCSN
ncbi:MAG: protein kinase [Proteobacteria bacterium]|nr:protein kinase [Pseudomonadota bacterium]